MTTITVIAKAAAMSVVLDEAEEMMLSELSLAAWESIEYWSTMAVLLGVVGETLVSFHREPLTFRYVAGKSALALLVLGIAGELIAGDAAARLSGEEIAAANLKAVKAVEQTAHAVERAAGLGVSLNGLRDFVQGRQREADRIRIEIESRESKLGEALREADALIATADARQRELEDALSPRFVDQMRPVARLRRLASPPVLVTAGPGAEPSELADEIGRMFKFSGAKVAMLPDDGRNRRDGLRLGYLAPGDERGAGSPAHLLASAACEELSAQGVATSVIAVSGSDARGFDWPPSVPANALLVRVGPKHDAIFLKRWIEKDGGSLVDLAPSPDEACR